jgi:hypothetical protein
MMTTEFKPVRKKLLTRPVLKWEVSKPKYLKIEASMHIGKEIKSRSEKEGDKKKDPATIAHVIDLTTGEPAQIIVNAVLKSVLIDEYPGDAYVGKCFSITKQARQPGKQYDPFQIEEIEDPTEVAPTSKETGNDPAPSQLHTGKRRA